MASSATGPRVRWNRIAIAGAFVAALAPADAIDLQGHRGARGLAPENTLAGFRTSLAIGVTTLKTDLALSVMIRV